MVLNIGKFCRRWDIKKGKKERERREEGRSANGLEIVWACMDADNGVINRRIDL